MHGVEGTAEGVVAQRLAYLQNGDVPFTRADLDGLVDEFRRRAHRHDREQGLDLTTAQGIGRGTPPLHRDFVYRS
jgi:hypothetical protein